MNYLVIVAFEEHLMENEPSSYESERYMKASFVFAEKVKAFFLNKCIQLSVNSFFINSQLCKVNIENAINEIHGELFYDNLEYNLPNNLPSFFITEVNELTFSTNKNQKLAIDYLLHLKLS